MQKQNLANPFANIHPPQQQFSGQQPQQQFSGQQQVQYQPQHQYQQQPTQQYQQPVQQYQQPVHQYQQPTQTQQPEEKKKKGKKKYLLLLLLLLLIPMIWFFKGFIGGDTPSIPGINWDQNQGVGDLTGKSKDEIKAALNAKVAEGMINISMNTNPIFETGTAKGTLMITNSVSNHHPQLVEIFTKDDNTLVYSGAVDIGNKVEQSTLLVDLPKGEHGCVAYFSPLNPDTGEKLGTAGANINITVLN